MSVKNISRSLTSTKNINPSQKTNWVRNPNWLNIIYSPPMAGLIAILPESNYASLSVTGTGVTSYTVDWGDGTIQTYSSGIASHTYDYNTFNTSNSTLITDKGLTYKQAIVNVYNIINNGSNITISVNQNQGYGSPAGSAPTTASSNWLDLRFNQFGYSSYTTIEISNLTQNCQHNMLEQCIINDPYVLNLSYMFNNCLALRYVRFDSQLYYVTNASYAFSNCNALETVIFTSDPIGSTSNTNMSAMFQFCNSLETAPYMNTSNVTNMSYMFSNCTSLKNIPLYDTSIVTDMNYMCNGNLIQSIPLFNTSVVTNMSGMFNACYSLTSVPLFNTQNVTNMNNMFNSCYSLTSVPLFNTQNVTTMLQIFYGCSILETVPAFNTIKVTNMSYMFYSCFKLQNISTLNTIACTNISYMFQNCYELRASPLLTNISLATTNNAGIFSSCKSLASVPAINFNATGYSTAFSNCQSLSSIYATFNSTISIINCKLSKDALELIFKNLGTTASQTLNITGNLGLDTAVSNTNSSSTGSVTLTTTNTTGIKVGQTIIGTGTAATTGKSVSFTDATDTVGLSAHGLPNGTLVLFSVITTTTGINIKSTTYYVINATANTFQLSLTPGGSVIALTNNGTGTIRYASKVVNIVTNSSITLDTPMVSTTTSTAKIFRFLNTLYPLTKSWTITG